MFIIVGLGLACMLVTNKECVLGLGSWWAKRNRVESSVKHCCAVSEDSILPADCAAPAVDSQWMTKQERLQRTREHA